MNVQQKLDNVLVKASRAVEETERLRARNAELLDEVQKLKQKLQDETARAEDLNNKIKIIKLAQNMAPQGTESIEMAEVKRKLNDYIREIDWCYDNAERLTMAGKSDTVNINVLIAERWYPLKVLISDEAKVRRAVKLVNEKIAQYQESYAGKDKQDYMAMCLLNFAVEFLSMQQQGEQHNRMMEEKISRLDDILSGR